MNRSFESCDGCLQRAQRFFSGSSLAIFMLLAAGSNNASAQDAMAESALASSARSSATGTRIAPSGDMKPEPFAQNRRADRDELDALRGGFSTALNGAGLDVSFGIERASYVNGQLVASTGFNISSLGKLDAAPAPVQAVMPGMLQNGFHSGMPANVQQLAPGTFSLIQNSLDNQVLSQITTIHAAVNSLAQFRAAQFGAALNDQMLNLGR